MLVGGERRRSVGWGIKVMRGVLWYGEGWVCECLEEPGVTNVGGDVFGG